jgi:FHS family L-fucose permease-like MFS transporter
MKNSRISSLITLITVFFFWGFVAASNAILTPLFKDIFQLTQTQAQLVEWAFYISYFAGSLIYFLITFLWKDPLNHIGYKKGLIIGLLISAVGAICFIPAANLNSYPLLLTSLFIVGLGFTLQQIVANPYVIALGDPSTGSHRLNLAGGINSFGTTIGPVLLSYALFGQMKSTPQHATIDAIKMPSIILCCMFLLSAFVLTVAKLPPITREEHTEKSLGALKYPQLTLGMLAIFFYVGAEVTISSNMGAFLKLPEIKNLDASQISPYVSLYWGSLMIGRWRGSLTIFNFSKRLRFIMMTVIPLIAFGVICAVNHLRGGDISDYKYYVPYIFLAIIFFFIGQEKPARTLMLFGCIAAIFLLVGIFTTGNIAVFSFISAGLYCSVMWPCIFTLAIAGLGKYTNQGSSLLVMMILGGGLIPLLQGRLSDGATVFGIDMSLGAHHAYIVPVFCFAYLAFYGWKVRSVFKAQGMDADAVVLE